MALQTSSTLGLETPSFGEEQAQSAVDATLTFMSNHPAHSKLLARWGFAETKRRAEACASGQAPAGNRNPRPRFGRPEVNVIGRRHEPLQGRKPEPVAEPQHWDDGSLAKRTIDPIVPLGANDPWVARSRRDESQGDGGDTAAWPPAAEANPDPFALLMGYPPQ